MKIEMNELETRLRSWAPRPPSANVKQLIFAAPPGPPRLGVADPGWRWGWGWLAPATAMLMFIAIAGRSPDASIFSGNSSPMVAVILSNHYAAAYWSRGTQPQANAIPAETFEWTKGGGLTSSISSFPGRKPTQ